MNAAPGFTVEDVSFAYGNTQVLQHINLTIQAGEFLCLLGPSGSRTTRCIPG